MVQRQVIVRDAGHQLLDELDATDIPALAYDASGAAAAAAAASQPLDSDLTAIAALTTTSYGRAFLALADAAAGRTALGLGTAATHATGDYDAAGAAASAQAASQPLDSDLTAIAALTTTSYGRSLLEAANAAALRTLAGLGTLATQSGTFSGTSSGTNTGDQTLGSLGAAPSTVPYLVTTADAGLSAEVVVPAAVLTVLDDTTVAAMVDTLGGASSTGTGGLVRATSPTLVTPALGTPSALVATNATGTAAGLTAGNVTTNANLTGDVTSVGNATTAITAVRDKWTEIVKSTDQTVTNSAVLVNDSELVFAAVSGGIYMVELYLIYSGNDTTADYRFNFGLPTITGWHRWGTGFGAGEAVTVNTGAQASALTTFGADLIGGADGADGLRFVLYEMWFRAGGNANFQFKFANSVAASGKTSTTRAGSVLRYRRLV